jgi:hypothetical protein
MFHPGLGTAPCVSPALRLNRRHVLERTILHLDDDGGFDEVAVGVERRDSGDSLERDGADSVAQPGTAGADLAVRGVADRALQACLKELDVAEQRRSRGSPI